MLYPLLGKKLCGNALCENDEKTDETVSTKKRLPSFCKTGEPGVPNSRLPTKKSPARMATDGKSYTGFSTPGGFRLPLVCSVPCCIERAVHTLDYKPRSGNAGEEDLTNNIKANSIDLILGWSVRYGRFMCSKLGAFDSRNTLWRRVRTNSTATARGVPVWRLQRQGVFMFEASAWRRASLRLGADQAQRSPTAQ